MAAFLEGTRWEIWPCLALKSKPINVWISCPMEASTRLYAGKITGTSIRMYVYFFNDFINSSDTLRIYEGGSLIYSSKKERMLPLLEYIEKYAPHNRKVTVFDKIMGNGAALLCAKINCQKVFSPMGSELAIRTLVKFGISYQLEKIVPYISRKDGENMCPIELLSVDKEPEDFYKELLHLNDG